MSIARAGHTATRLIDGRVLVVGGNSLYAELYQPSTGKWALTGSMKFPRTGHTATLLSNGKVLVAGGIATVGPNSGTYPLTTELFDPATGNWTATGSIKAGRCYHTASLLKNGKVLIAGGSNCYDFYSYSGWFTETYATTELYDLTAGTWTAAGNMSTSRTMHTAVALTDGRVLVAGGYNLNESNTITLSSAELYNPTTGTWTGTGSLATGRGAHTATLLQDGKVLAAGGGQPPYFETGSYSSAEIYDPSLGTWAATGAMLDGRGFHAAALLPDGNVLVTGGCSNCVEADIYKYHQDLATTELYSPSIGGWVRLGSMMSARSGHTATLLDDGQVLIAGGYINYEYPSKMMLSGAEVYTAENQPWMPAVSTITQRTGHTATLLQNGGVLIVGGVNGGTYLDSVDRYDPISETWISTPHLNIARAYHTATLLPDGRVLVTGGGTSMYNGLTASAEVYDPVKGSWTVTSSMHTPRAGHTATLLPDGRVLVAGGTSGQQNGLASAEIFDPATETWTETPNMPYVHSWHTATLLSNGKVLVAGGYALIGSTFTQIDRAEVYDPVSGAWASTGRLPWGRGYHTATLLQDGRVLITGGGGPDGNEFTHNDCELYNPVTGAWTLTGFMTEARKFHEAALLPNGMVMVTGGHSSSDLNSTEVFNPATGKWTIASPMIVSRSSHTMTVLNNQKILVFGGYYYGSQYSTLSTGELLDLSTGAWRPTGQVTVQPIQNHTSTLLTDGSILVVGGRNGGGQAVSASMRYDPAGRGWASTGSLNTPRSNHAAVLLPDGNVLAAGGVDANGQALSSAELFDVTTGTWSAVGSMGTPRSGQIAVLLLDGRVLIFGGTSGSGDLASAEIYDPQSRTWSDTGSMTAGRNQAAAALLPDGRVLVVGGSNGSAALQSTEIYNPAAGNWSSTGSLTDARQGHSVSLLPSGKVLAAGGFNGRGALDGAELFDPATGQWTATGALSTARSGHSASLLPNGQLLVAGGLDAGGAPLASAETYDPSTGEWKNAGSVLAPRAYHTAVMLPGGMVVMIGGVGTNPDQSGTTLVEYYDGMQGAWSATGDLKAPFSSLTNNADQAVTLLRDGKVLIVGSQINIHGSYASHTEVYDPSTGQWTSKVGELMLRGGHTATLLPNGKVLVVGGRNPLLGWSTTLASAEIYDPDADTWTYTGSMATPREHHTATLLQDGKVLVAGGDWNEGAYSTAEVYDPATGTWTKVGNLATERKDHTATLLPDGSVLVTGGHISSLGEVTASCERYDPHTRTWSHAGDLIRARAEQAAGLLQDGRVLVAGGAVSGYREISSAEVYDPRTDTWSAAGSMSSARIGSSLTILLDGRALAVGGYTSSGVSLKDGELFDPTTETWSEAGEMGTPRRYHSAVLLPDGQVLVAGGYSSVVSAELYKPDIRFPDAWRPVISSLADTLPLGSPLSFTGSQLRGALNSQGSTGRTNAADSNIPLVQLSRFDNAQVFWVPPALGSGFSTSQFTSAPLNDLPVGTYQTTVFVNGIPSLSKTVAVGYPCSILSQGVTVVYNGQPVPAAAQATPAGLALVFTYTGAAPTNYGPTSTPPVNAGSYRVTVGPKDSSYLCQASTTITIQKASQTINFAPLNNTTFGSPDFAIQVSASSGLPVSLSAGSSAACTINGVILHLTHAGTCTTTASQAGNNNYNAAQAVIRSFEVLKADQSITFNPIPDQTIGAGDFQASASSSSGLAVSLSAGSSGACTVSGRTVHLVHGGTCQITAYQAGNSDYNSAQPVVRSFEILKVNQTITFASLPDRNFGESDFPVNATASSGLAVSFQAGQNGACAVSGTIVHMITAGVCTITATQDGNSDYNPAQPVARSFNILNQTQNQRITFDPLPDRVFGDEDFTVSASASSGLPVAFSTGEGSACTVAGNSVHITGAGSCTVMASQPGNSQYNPAAAVSQTFKIGKATASIQILGLGQMHDGSPKPVTVVTDPKGISVMVTYTGTAGTVYGPSQQPPTEEGKYEVTVTIEDSNYQGSASATLTISGWQIFLSIINR